MATSIGENFLLITACAFPSAPTTAGHEEFLQSVDPDSKSQRELPKAEIGKRVSRQRGRKSISGSRLGVYTHQLHSLGGVYLFIEEETESWRDCFPKVSQLMSTKTEMHPRLFDSSLCSPQYTPCCSAFLNSGCCVFFFLLFNMKALKTQCQKALTKQCFAIQ